MMRFRSLVLAAAAAALSTSAHAASEFDAPLRALAAQELAVFATDPVVIEAVRTQNALNAGMEQAEIDALDQEWRAEVGGASGTMIGDVLAREGSAWLRGQKEMLGGLVTEVFVTDVRGLNVIQSDVTSDYWQGDEAKWSEVFGKAAGWVHLGEVELDESTQTYQNQVSMPVVDPATGEALGAVTIGIDLSLIQ